MKARRLLPAMAACASLCMGAQAGELRFITCPIYQDADAGRKSGCWLVDDRATGQRYDVGASPTKPDWNHPVLVEGKVAPDQDHACAGIRMAPVRISVLPGDCTRHMIPAGDSRGRPYVLAARNVSPLSHPRPSPPPPYRATTFTLFFDFGSDFLIYQYDDFFLDQAISWIRAAHPRRVVVTGYADAVPVEVSGQSLAEPASLARQRAGKVSEALRRLGVPGTDITTTWNVRPASLPQGDADGLDAPSRRRVDIEAIP